MPVVLYINIMQFKDRDKIINICYNIETLQRCNNNRTMCRQTNSRSLKSQTGQLAY